MATKLKETNDCFKYDDGVFLTPYKYNGGQLYIRPQKPNKTLLIGVDWFEFTVNGQFIDSIENPKNILSFSDGDIVLIKDELRPNGTKHFKYCYTAYLHGEKFGTINTVPRSSVLSPTVSIFKVENHILYQRGWVARTEFIMNELGVNLHNVTRLDIAVDGGQFLNDYKDLDKGVYKQIGRGTRSSHYRGNELEGFYIGSRASEKYLRGYNKTKELKKSANKGYIKDFWTKNGLEHGEDLEDVERLEITLKRKAMQRVKDFDMGRLEDASYLAGLMCSQVQKLYVFIENSGDSNASRRTKIQPVDWSYFDAVEVERLNKTNEPSVVWAAQQSVSFEMRESYAGLGEIKGDLWEQAFSRCHSRCEKYGILEWFTNKVPKWQREKVYHEKMRLEVEKVRDLRFNKVGNSAVFTSM